MKMALLLGLNMAAQKDPELNYFPMDTSNLQLYIEQFSMKKNPESNLNCSSTSNDKKAVFRRAGEAEIQSCQKPQAQHRDPQVGGISQIQSISLKVEGLESHITCPNPWDLQWRDKPSKYLALKTNGAHIQEVQRAIGN